MAQINVASNTLKFTISEISKLTWVRSPEVLLHGIPWEVEVKKYENGTSKSLAAYLYCTKKWEKLNWKATACAWMKLLPFSDDQQVIEHNIPPFVYDRFDSAFGTHTLIKWDDLLTKYVDNDTIQLEVKIEADDPNSSSRSILKFKYIDKSCECGCQATFELAVANVSKLMAVQSPEFIIRGMPWCISVYKNGEQLDLRLRLMQQTGNVSCQTSMSAQLVSSKANVDSIEKIVRQKIQWPVQMSIGKLVPWEEMLKPENGFVTDDSITLKIRMKTDKPVGDLSIACANNVAKRRRLECAICLEELYDQAISATKCGHSFCTACITTAVQKRGVCPMCKKAVILTDLRPLFLSGAQ